MAKRPAWSVQDDVVICENFDFMWSGGFSITQKQKNIRALHQSIYEMKHEKHIFENQDHHYYLMHLLLKELIHQILNLLNKIYYLFHYNNS